MEYFHINGIINGEKINYYINSDNIDNKIIKSKINYINNKREGKYIEYYTNGNIKIIFNCINDKIEGEYKLYYNNGSLKIKINYINNKREGIMEYYNNDGNLKEYEFINDKCEEYEKDHNVYYGGLMSLVAYGAQDIYLT